MRSGAALTRTTCVSPPYGGPALIQEVSADASLGNPAGGLGALSFGFNPTVFPSSINQPISPPPPGQFMFDTTFQDDDGFPAAALPGIFTQLLGQVVWTKRLNYIIPDGTFVLWVSWVHGNNVNADVFDLFFNLLTGVDPQIINQLLAG